ncbi:hypothetical protein [Anabaena sp. 4-3]|nr:hypothetical protein [Anabaena sp. 4-3]
MRLQRETPNYDKLRDRILMKLRVGRQSPTGRAIDLLIRELKRGRRNLE